MRFLQTLSQKAAALPLLLLAAAALSAHPHHGVGGGAAAPAVNEAASAASGEGYSPAIRSTAGFFGTDVDAAFSVSGFSDLALFPGSFSGGYGKRFLAFTRLGAPLAGGRLELGVAAQITDNLYLAALFNGWLKHGGDVSGNDALYLKKPPDYPPEESAGEYHAGNPLSLAFLLGVNTLGVKLSFEDSLKTNNSYESLDGQSLSWSLSTGRIKGSIDVGGFRLGPLYRARFTMDFVFNSVESTYRKTGEDALVTRKGGGAGHETVGWDFLQDHAAYDDDGPSFFEPALFLNFNLGRAGPGSFGLENELAVRFYGLSPPARGADGGEDGDVRGLSVWNSTQGATPAESGAEALWNDKFYLRNTITPDYTVEGTFASIGFACGFSLPVSLLFGADDYSAKVVRDGKTARAEGFYRAGSFGLELAPTVRAALSVRPAGAIDIHAGIEFPLVKWSFSSTTTEDVDRARAISGDDAVKYAVETIIDGHYSRAAQTTVSEPAFFPSFSLNAGFTVSYASTVSLDFVFLTVTDGYVSIDSSVLLSVKL